MKYAKPGGWTARERGFECTCSKCGKKIKEDEPRYNPKSVRRGGRLCVECFLEKMGRRK